MKFNKIVKKSFPILTEDYEKERISHATHVFERDFMQITGAEEQEQVFGKTKNKFRKIIPVALMMRTKWLVYYTESAGVYRR